MESRHGFLIFVEEGSELQEISFILFEGTLPDLQLQRLGLQISAKNELAEEKRSRHVLANALSAAIQSEVIKAAQDSVRIKCNEHIASENLVIRNGSDALRRYLWSAIGPNLLAWFRAKMAVRSTILKPFLNSVFKKELLNSSPLIHEVFGTQALEDLINCAKAKPLTR